MVRLCNSDADFQAENIPSGCTGQVRQLDFGKNRPPFLLPLDLSLQPDDEEGEPRHHTDEHEDRADERVRVKAVAVLLRELACGSLKADS